MARIGAGHGASEERCPGPGENDVVDVRPLQHEVPKCLDGFVGRPCGDVILALRPSGRCSAAVVAQHLGVDRRTVHRHLTREGCTFNSILDEVRRELAERYLAEGARTMSNVSALLGFAAPSVFSRWYARRFKVAPSSQRADRAPNRRRDV